MWSKEFKVKASMFWLFFHCPASLIDETGSLTKDDQIIPILFPSVSECVKIIVEKYLFYINKIDLITLSQSLSPVCSIRYQHC